MKKIKESQDAAEFATKMYNDEKCVMQCEYSFVILTDSGNRIIAYAKVGEGELAQTIDNEKIIKAALDAKASGVVLVHNHPSSTPLPSKSDLRITDAMHKSLALRSIKLLDHIILSKGTFFSFVDNEEKSYRDGCVLVGRPYPSVAQNLNYA